MQNILVNRSKKIDSKLYRANYYDFMLYKGDTRELSLSEINDMSIVDFSDFEPNENQTLYSKTTWPDAINKGALLKDFGFTGMDNGMIRFDKNTITDEEFLGLILGTKFAIASGDTRFFMNPVYGNYQDFSYGYGFDTDENNVNFMKLNGGFYQGFFKLDGFDYKVLPERLTHSITMHFDLRPRSDYNTENTVNEQYPENKGIFFFMGARAENKFSQLYNNGIESKLKFSDDSLISQDGLYEIDTDNKFIMFNNTETGLTVSKWIEGLRLKMTMEKRPNINYFPIMNRTETGYTVNNIDEYIEKKASEDAESGIQKYNVTKDLINNAFALMVKDDGSIGYRSFVLDCESDERLGVAEEFSKPGIVKIDQWNSINVVFDTARWADKCDLRSNTMRIKIFVNGFLIFISKELPALSFKALNDKAERQEGVPYNISLGGGTLGLSEAILPDYPEITDYVFPLEQYFCGSFMGDIKSFKIYDGKVPFSSITSFL